MKKNPFHPPVHSTAAPPSYYFTTNNNGLQIFLQNKNWTLKRLLRLKLLEQPFVWPLPPQPDPQLMESSR